MLVAANNSHQTVKDKADYVCNGTDDNVEINLALEAGHARLAAGTFHLGAPVEMPDFGALVGSGFNTILMAQPALNNHLVILEDENVEQVLLRDFRLHGLAGQQESGCGVYLNNIGGSFSQKDTNHRLMNVSALWIRDDGIVLLGSPTNGQNPSSTTLVNVFAYGCGGNGFIVDVPDARIVNCESGGAGENGFVFMRAGTHVANCKVYYSGGHGYIVQNVTQGLVNCSSQENDGHGYLVEDAQDVLISNCWADSNAMNGFRLDDVSRAYLDGCHAVRRPGQKQQQYGFSLGPDVDHICISGYAQGNILGPVEDQSIGVHVDMERIKRW